MTRTVYWGWRWHGSGAVTSVSYPGRAGVETRCRPSPPRSRRCREAPRGLTRTQHCSPPSLSWTGACWSPEPERGMSEKIKLIFKRLTEFYLHINMILRSEHEVVNPLGDWIVCVSVVCVAECRERRMETRGWKLFCERVLHNTPHHPVRVVRVLYRGRVQVPAKNCNICIRESDQAHLIQEKILTVLILTFAKLSRTKWLYIYR